MSRSKSRAGIHEIRSLLMSVRTMRAAVSKMPNADFVHLIFRAGKGRSWYEFVCAQWRKRERHTIDASDVFFSIYFRPIFFGPFLRSYAYVKHRHPAPVTAA